jgi:transposase
LVDTLEVGFWGVSCPVTEPVIRWKFRQQMVDLAQFGRTPEELAREFEPTAQSISTWRDVGKRIDGPTRADREELARLRRENHLASECDILAGVAAWFARESKVSPNGFTVHEHAPGQVSRWHHGQGP